MHIAIKASSGGATLFEGDRLTLISSHARIQEYACARTGTYPNGAEVPIVALDAAIELKGGERLNWQAPRPGCAYEAVAVKPLTRADFDRLERKVDDLVDFLGKESFRAKSTPLAQFRAVMAELKALQDAGPIRVSVEGAPS